MREAERAREAVPIDPFVEIAKVEVATSAVVASPVAPESQRDAERAGRRDRKPVSSHPISTAARVKSDEPAQRTLRRAEVRIVRAADAPKRERKNPLSVLVTMVAVGGMVALAGLPAYASFTNQVAAEAKTDAASQDLLVPSTINALAPTRDGYTATSPDALAQMSRDALRAAANEAYLLSGARELGDDYPWPYELTDDMGGGLSPLNYYYRECVDFVAWRLNRDAGSYSAPFRWVWSTLTPNGGNGGQWMYNWQQKGWPVSNTPVPGAVAYTGGNHIAYVKSVLDGGMVVIEEYNYVPGAYSQRIIPASSVVAFLYPPS